MPEDDVNVRIPRDMMPVVGHTLAMLEDLPRFAGVRLSNTAVIRIALSIGLEQLQKEARETGAAQPKKRKKK